TLPSCRQFQHASCLAPDRYGGRSYNQRYKKRRQIFHAVKFLMLAVIEWIQKGPGYQYAVLSHRWPSEFQVYVLRGMCSDVTLFLEAGFPRSSEVNLTTHIFPVLFFLSRHASIQ